MEIEMGWDKEHVDKCKAANSTGRCAIEGWWVNNFSEKHIDEAFRVVDTNPSAPGPCCENGGDDLLTRHSCPRLVAYKTALKELNRTRKGGILGMFFSDDDQ